MSSGDNTAFRDFMRRLLRAYSRRLVGSDPEDLTEMLGLRQDLDDAIADAVQGMRQRGVSWSRIARAAGTTKQAAQQRWGQPGLDDRGRS